VELGALGDNYERERHGEMGKTLPKECILNSSSTNGEILHHKEHKENKDCIFILSNGRGDFRAYRCYGDRYHLIEVDTYLQALVVLDRLECEHER
jgi:hypothetical protein